MPAMCMTICVADAAVRDVSDATDAIPANARYNEDGTVMYDEDGNIVVNE